MSPSTLQNLGSKAKVAATCIANMNAVVPALNFLWVGGNGPRGLIIPARKRESREVEEFSGMLEIKRNSRFCNEFRFCIM